MITILLAWINAEYNSGYQLLFLGTIIIDMLFIDFLSGLLKK